MGKTSTLSEETGYIKETFTCKDGHDKRKDLTEAEEIKKRQQKYTEELYKKGLNNPNNQWCGHSPRAGHSAV